MLVRAESQRATWLDLGCGRSRGRAARSALAAVTTWRCGVPRARQRPRSTQNFCCPPDGCV